MFRASRHDIDVSNLYDYGLAEFSTGSVSVPLRPVSISSAGSLDRRENNSFELARVEDDLPRLP